MHYKDGTPAVLGDIVQRDDGSVGILIGGQLGQDYCSSTVVSFKSGKSAYGFSTGQGYTGVLIDENGGLIQRATVVLEHSSCTPTRECVKIGHVDI